MASGEWIQVDIDERKERKRRVSWGEERWGSSIDPFGVGVDDDGGWVPVEDDDGASVERESSGEEWLWLEDEEVTSATGSITASPFVSVQWFRSVRGWGSVVSVL